MAIELSQRHCPHCQRSVLAQRQSRNHVLHLLLTLFLCGLWLPIWAMIAASPLPWHCPTCGGRIKEATSWDALLAVVVVIVIFALAWFALPTP
jgi:hypothetical protein